MCGTCGCSDGNQTVVTDDRGSHTHVMADGTVVTHTHHHTETESRSHTHAHSHSHPRPAPHGHAPSPTPPPGPVPAQAPSPPPAEAHRATTHATPPPTPAVGPREVETIEAQIFAKNDHLAERNRGWFLGRDVVALNLMSSPGSGKTTLLERTLRELEMPVSVLEGDQETARDAERLRATGAPVVQINTGKGCHLEADMIWHGIRHLKPPAGSILFIENVGNLVCPALFNLGEDARIVLFSVTEGEDKPEKYPHMFRAADLVLMTKIDLLPHLDFDRAQALDAVKDVQPRAEILEVSAKTGEGLDAWYAWVRACRRRRDG